jgi:hypothetical protein
VKHHLSRGKQWKACLANVSLTERKDERFKKPKGGTERRVRVCSSGCTAIIVDG